MNWLQQLALVGQIISALQSIRETKPGEPARVTCYIKYKYKGETYAITAIEAGKV